MNKGTTSEKTLNGNSLNFIQAPDGTLLIQIKVNWKIGNSLPSADEVGKKLTAEMVKKYIRRQRQRSFDW